MGVRSSMSQPCVGRRIERRSLGLAKSGSGVICLVQPLEPIDWL